MDRRVRNVGAAAMAALLLLLLSVAANNSHPTAAPARTAAKAARAEEKPAAPAEDARVWPELLAGNRRFVKGDHLVHAVREQRAELAKGQHPDAIVLTCADSRVAPEWVFDQGLGEIFVVRTAGNVVDPIALGSIEYAVEHLHARLLVVMGHERCGAVAAALAGEPLPSENLEAIMRKIRPGLPTPRAGASKDDQLQAAVEANVRRTSTDLVIASPIVREHVVKGTLAMVQAVYHLESGVVEELKSSDAVSSTDSD